MASAALSAREEVAWRPGKRPRVEAGRTPVMVSGARRRPFEEVKWALLTKEQEMERRHVQEAISRLDAIEELRRRARERKLDRDSRRIAFAALLERSTLTLQRCERGRQGRRVARRRVGAAERIVKWMLAMVRRAAVKKAIRNRTILRIMLSVEAMVEERLEEACFVLQNVVAIRHFQHRRFARMIQKALRKRVALVRRSAAIIVRAARSWLARGFVRRARIRRGILRHRGSLSRRARGLPELDPFALTAVNEKAGDTAGEGHWWDVGASVAPRPRWGTQLVEREVERSRQRAASLGDLIRSGQEVAAVRGGAGAAALAASVDSGGKQDTARRRGSMPLAGSGSRRRASGTVVGFKKGASGQRAASMVDPREAEAAAWKHELARRQARKEALTMVVDFKKLSLREKHLLRQREFDLEKQKRLLAAEKELQKSKQLKARDAVEKAKQRAREAKMLRRQEEESSQGSLDKINSYMEEKAAKELAERKAMVARERKERQAKEIAHAKRKAANALFEKEKEERLERARRKRRVEEEEEAKTTEAAAPRGRKESTRKAVAAEKAVEAEAGQPVAATGLDQRGKRAVAKNNSSLDPIAVGDREGRKRRRDRSNGVGGSLQGARRSRVAAGVRDGRLKPSQSAALPVLPTVPPWKAMAAAGTGRGDKKRTRRRPPKREVERGKGGEGAAGNPKGARKTRNSAADLKRVLVRSRSAGGASPGGFNRVDVRDPESGMGGAHVGAVVAFDEDERGEAEEDRGGTHTGSLADGELLTFSTLDSVFLPPGPGADSGGAQGLGATSAGEELSRPGWGSRSNRSSNGDETLSICLSDTETLCEEGTAVRGGVAGPSRLPIAHGVDGRAALGVAEEPAGSIAPSTPRVANGCGQDQGEPPRPGERGAERKSCLDATGQSLAPSNAQGASLESGTMAVPSASPPDNVSGLGESRTLLGDGDGNCSAESAPSLSPESVSDASIIRSESGKLRAGAQQRDAGESMERNGGCDRGQTGAVLAGIASGGDNPPVVLAYDCGDASRPAQPPPNPQGDAAHLGNGAIGSETIAGTLPEPLTNAMIGGSDESERQNTFHSSFAQIAPSNQEEQSSKTVVIPAPLPLPTASASLDKEGSALSHAGTESGDDSSYHGGGGDAAPATG